MSQAFAMTSRVAIIHHPRTRRINRRPRESCSLSVRIPAPRVVHSPPDLPPHPSKKFRFVSAPPV